MKLYRCFFLFTKRVVLLLLRINGQHDLFMSCLDIFKRNFCILRA